ncbi:MAG: peptidase M14 [Piscinibacter sp.]|nr:peptidase M14 [Piscinibacter sp.]
MTQDWRTPFERGNGNQTATWQECIAFHRCLAGAFPQWLSLAEIGRSDGGTPIHGGVFSADGEFDPARVKAAGRTVFFNNNGIHPGEPEGIDVCMALLRDLCLDEEKRRALGDLVLIYIPAYNVDGVLDRADTSRVNQVGPEQFGFRGTARHLDLNRDFIKAASRSAWAFSRFFTTWDPDVMVDTHTSNGADYQHVVTLIPTQPDKLGGSLGTFLRERMLPALYEDMNARGEPMCPYVNTVKDTPEEGIADFLDLPRFSTGYAALHHCIGFMPETHMLKTFAQRYAGTRHLLDSALAFSVREGAEIRARRAVDRAAVAGAPAWPLQWALDETQAARFRFRGYRAQRLPSALGPWTRLRYDRAAPFEEDIPHHDRYRVAAQVAPPAAYLLPQAWPEVAARLRLNGVELRALAADRAVAAEAWHVVEDEKAPRPFEGEHLHTRLELRAEALTLQARAGDWLVPLGRGTDRYVIETLEPQGADSFFRWGFFDAVLDRKETYSDYLFEDEALNVLEAEPDTRAAFEAWKRANPALAGDAEAVLGFIHRHCRRYAEPAWRRIPVYRLAELGGLA